MTDGESNGVEAAAPSASTENQSMSLSDTTNAGVSATTSSSIPSGGGGIFLRLRGLPWEVTEEDIRIFTKGMALDPFAGIFIARNFQGRPNGEAYVKCASVSDAEEGLKRHRRMMGRRYIEVFPATEEEMKAAIENSSKLLVPTANQNLHSRYEGIVKMRGLPYHCTVQDIKQFFAGLHVDENSIHRAYSADGRPSGEAFVEFKSEELAGEAIKKFGERIGSRYIELFRSSKGEMEEILHRSEAQVATQGMLHGDLDAKCCIKLRGLPFDCTRQAIRDFFDPLSSEIVENGVGIKYLRENRPSGEGFVEFSSEEIAEKAMAKQRAAIGTRYIELFRVPRREMMRALGVDGGGRIDLSTSSFGERPRFPFRGDPWGGPPFGRGGRGRGDFYFGRGGRGRGRFNDYPPYERERYYDRPYGGYRGGRGGGGGGYGGGGSGGYDASGYSSYGMQASRGYDSSGYGMSSAGTYGTQQGYGTDMSYMSGTATQGYGVSSGQSAYSGKLYHIKMRGLPYRATEQDILSFLRGYSVVPDSITIAQGLDGRPSGEGWAGFYTYEEAQRAARELNGQRMYSRYIEIFPEH